MKITLSPINVKTWAWFAGIVILSLYILYSSHRSSYYLVIVTILVTSLILLSLVIYLMLAKYIIPKGDLIKIKIQNKEIEVSSKEFKRALSRPINLYKNDELTPVKIHGNNLSLPGYIAGECRLKNGLIAIVYLTQWDSVIYIKPNQIRDYALLLSIDNHDNNR